MFVKKNNQYSVKCRPQVAPTCVQTGEFQDSEEEAQEWVEMECWIFSGEGWICPNCHEHFMFNLVKVKKAKGSDGTEGPRKPEGEDGLDSDLEKGIPTIL